MIVKGRSVKEITMQRKLIFTLLSILALALITATFIHGFYEPDSYNYSHVKIQECTEYEWVALTMENANPDRPLTTLSGSFPRHSEEDLMEMSALVVHGRVVGRTQAFTVENSFYGASTIFTDYFVEVYEVLRGEVDSTTITVRVEGGATSERTLITTFTPTFIRGGEYLLFLTVPSGDAFDTQGDYYYIIGGSQGVFERNPIQRFSDGEGDINFIQYETPIFKFDIMELRSEIEEVNIATPIPTEYVLRQQGIDALKRTVANGVLDLTDEELEEWIYELYNAPFRPAVIIE